MRILIANHHCGLVGGVETYLQALIPSLVGQGHSVGLVTECEPIAGSEVILAGTSEQPLWTAAGNHEATIIDELAKWRPDVAYVHGLSSPRLEAALLDRFPCVLFAHGYYGSCISGSKRFALPRPRPCGRRFGPACLLHYYPHRCGGWSPVTLLRSYRQQVRRQRLLGRYRAILVASRHMEGEYRYHDLPAGRIHRLSLFPPGVAPDTEPPRVRPWNGQILFLGRLTELKGGRPLIRAVAAVNRRLGRALRLVVAGDGPERAALEHCARSEGFAADFLGWVGPAQRVSLMRQADLLAVPSLWPEPFGLVGIEAGCVGLPAVGFAVGGISDWLTPGVSGELAPGERPGAAELAEAIIRALRDDAHWQRLRVGAWETARRFTQEEHLRRLLPILQAAAAA